MQNPFTLTFGRSPLESVDRPVQINEIIENFTADTINQQMFIITGVRGSGKTVMMTEISHRLRENDDWVVIELNPATELLPAMLSKLNSDNICAGLIKSAKLDLSFFGFGVSIEGTQPITDAETAIIKILERLKKSGKRLLITIDEMTNSEYMKVFAGAFQIFVRQELPVFLLGTGLYENIEELQNEKSLTFLYRAPKIQLKPLNNAAIINKYKTIFNISQEKAAQMAGLTKGYPFAFQVLGYLYWENRDKKTLEQILPEYDQYLDEYVYSKIWSELSDLDKKIVTEMSLSGETQVKALRERLDMKSELFSVYRERLKRKGVIISKEYGKVTLALPRFDEFVKIQQLM